MFGIPAALIVLISLWMVAVTNGLPAAANLIALAGAGTAWWVAAARCGLALLLARPPSTLTANDKHSWPCSGALNAKCMGDPWTSAADAIVVLVAVDSTGRGDLCTGALLASPQEEELLILSATHCRQLATDADTARWAVVFRDELPCNASGTAALPGDNATLHGVEMVWQSGEADVMLLRLVDGLPPGVLSRAGEECWRMSCLISTQ